MASLYKSRDPFVLALLRLTEGQVRSFTADHPEASVTARQARGIAKRITGQLVSDWARLEGVRAIYGCAHPETAEGKLPSPPQAAGVRSGAPAAVSSEASDA